MKQWYKILLEKDITHTCPDLNALPVIINSKFEQNHPEVDFPDVYYLSRKYGLSPDQKSFVFKMIQDILPTRERLARLGKVQSSSCVHCQDQTDTMSHHLLTCPYNSEVSGPLLRCLSSCFANTNPEKIVSLDIVCSECQELPAVWRISTCIKFI